MLVESVVETEADVLVVVLDAEVELELEDSFL